MFNFFCRIQNLLTADTKLDIRYIYVQNLDEDDTANQLGNVRFILGHLLPLIDGVHTCRTYNRMLPMVKTSFGDKFNQIKELDVTFKRFVQSAMQLIMEWLTASSNEPKILQLWSGKKEIAQQVLDAIRKVNFIEFSLFPHIYFLAIHGSNRTSNICCHFLRL